MRSDESRQERSPVTWADFTASWNCSHQRSFIVEFNLPLTFHTILDLRSAVRSLNWLGHQELVTWAVAECARSARQFVEEVLRKFVRVRRLQISVYIRDGPAVDTGLQEIIGTCLDPFTALRGVAAPEIVHVSSAQTYMTLPSLHQPHHHHRWPPLASRPFHYHQMPMSVFSQLQLTACISRNSKPL